MDVGVKVDYPPFGRQRDGEEEPIGIEIDIAQLFADQLGVKLHLVPVSAATRNEKLIAGDVDLFIATMSDTEDRRKIVGAIEPNYYAAGRNIIAPNDTIKNWIDIKGKPVCGNAGAYYNSDVAAKYGAYVVEFDSLEEAKAALRDGHCVALVYDDAHLRWVVSLPEWSDFEIPVDSEDVTPWAIAVRPDDRSAPLGARLSEFVCMLHAEGTLLELERKYGLRQSRFLLAMRKKHKAEECG